MFLRHEAIEKNVILMVVLTLRNGDPARRPVQRADQ